MQRTLTSTSSMCQFSPKSKLPKEQHLQQRVSRPWWEGIEPRYKSLGEDITLFRRRRWCSLRSSSCCRCPCSRQSRRRSGSVFSRSFDCSWKGGSRDELATIWARGPFYVVVTWPTSSSISTTVSRVRRRRPHKSSPGRAHDVQAHVAIDVQL